jgi:hypothetical protein
LRLRQRHGAAAAAQRLMRIEVSAKVFDERANLFDGACHFREQAGPR